MKPLSDKEVARRLRNAAGRSAPDIWQDIENRLENQQYEFERPAPRQKPLRWKPLAAVAAVLVLTVGLLLTWPALKGALPVPSSSNAPGSSGAILLTEGDEYTVRTAGAAGEGNRLLDSLAAAETLMTDLTTEAEIRGDSDFAALKILEGYDEAFFEEFVVLVISRTEPSAHLEHRVRSVTVDNGLLVAKVEQTTGAREENGVETPFSLFVELRRDTLRNCTEYYVEENGIRERVQPLASEQEMAFRSRAALAIGTADMEWGPDVQLLYSMEDLEAYLQALGQVDLISQTGMLSVNDLLNGVLESGFPEHPLAVIRIRESDSRVRHRVAQIQGEDSLSITLQRLSEPAESASGDYCWMIFVELLGYDARWSGCSLTVEDHVVEAPVSNRSIVPVMCVDEAGFTSQDGESPISVQTVDNVEEWADYLGSMETFFDFSYFQDVLTPPAQDIHARYDEAFFANCQLIAVTIRGDSKTAYCGLTPLYDSTAGTWLLSTGDGLPYENEDIVGAGSWYQVYIEVSRDYGPLPDRLELTDQLAGYAWSNTGDATQSANGVLCLDTGTDGKPDILRMDTEQGYPVLKINGEIVARLTEKAAIDRAWLQAVNLDADGNWEVLISLPAGGAGEDTFLTAAKYTEDGWKLFSLPSMGEVSGYQVTVEIQDNAYLLVTCPETGLEQRIEYDRSGGWQTADGGAFGIDGASESFELALISGAGMELTIHQRIWTGERANTVAWLYTGFILGPDGWMVYEQYVLPGADSYEEVTESSYDEVTETTGRVIP